MDSNTDGMLKCGVCGCVGYAHRSPRAGNAAKLVAPWKNNDGKKGFVQNTMYLALTEKSVADRKTRVRGLASLKQVHMIHLISKDAIEISSRKKRHVDGTSSGNLLGPLPLNGWSFTATFKDKKVMYGKLRVAVGGVSVDQDDDEEEIEDEANDLELIPPTAEGKNTETCAAENREPVFYTSYGKEYFEEWIGLLNMTDMIHLTASDGAAAMACLTHRVGYLGMCMSDSHKEALETYLHTWMLKEFGREKSTFFQPTYDVEGKGTDKDDKDKKEKKPKDDDKNNKEEGQEEKGQERR